MAENEKPSDEIKIVCLGESINDRGGRWAVNGDIPAPPLHPTPAMLHAFWELHGPAIVATGMVLQINRKSYGVSDPGVGFSEYGTFKPEWQGNHLRVPLPERGASFYFNLDGTYTTIPPEGPMTRIALAARLMDLAAEIDAQSGAGALHIFVDDGNCEDEDLEFCMAQPGITAEELTWCRGVLENFTESERHGAWALAQYPMESGGPA